MCNVFVYEFYLFQLFMILMLIISQTDGLNFIAMEEKKHQMINNNNNLWFKVDGNRGI